MYAAHIVILDGCMLYLLNLTSAFCLLLRHTDAFSSICGSFLKMKLKITFEMIDTRIILPVSWLKVPPMKWADLYTF